MSPLTASPSRILPGRAPLDVAAALHAPRSATSPARVTEALGDHARRVAHDLLTLVLPVTCAGCGTVDERWCPPCRATLAGPPWRCEERAGRLDALDGRPLLPVWTLADNTGPVRHAVVAWKDEGRTDLTHALAAALGRAVGTVAPDVPRTRAGPLLVAAVPSTAAARRRRGGWLVDDLARGAVTGLRSAGVDARRAPVLRRRGGRDQAGLGARARARNLDGQVHVARHARERLAGRDVLLVDDVLTTGASVAASVAAVRAAGGCVVGCVTVASTPSPGPQDRAVPPTAWPQRSAATPSSRPRCRVGAPGSPRTPGSSSAGRAAIGPTTDRGVSVGA